MWYYIKDNFVFITVIAKPNSKQTKILEILPEGIKIALHATPQDGKANKELIDFLSEKLSVPKKEILVIRGEHSKQKLIKLPFSNVVQDFLRVK